MSTNNNASQTLFRFVSLRNPQLTETKERNLGFIHRPKGATGLFDAAVAGASSRVSKLNEMMKVAIGFSNAGLETEKKIEQGEFGRLLVIGRKISKREELQSDEWTYTRDFYKNLIDSNKELTSDGIKIFSLLWNNYIYQILTQKDFYVKETISHILMAIHLGFAQSMNLTDAEVIKVNGEKPLERALDGKIILPQSLFSEEQAVAGSSTSKDSLSASSLSLKTTKRLEAEAKAALTADAALHRKEALEKLGTELEKLQKKYQMSRDRAYQDEHARYVEENREALDAYEKKLAEIESRITEETPETDKIRYYEELKKYEVRPFLFSYKNEISLPELKEKLSPGSFDQFLKLFAEFDQKRASEEVVRIGIAILSDTTLKIGSQTITLDEGLQTYGDAINAVNNAISSSLETALENSPLQQQQYVNIGGASIPVVQTMARTPLAYSFFAHNAFGILGSGGFVNFSFEVDDASWSVANARIVATTDSAGSFEENFSNIQVVDDKITLPVSLINKFRASMTFRIEVIFDNGSQAYADLGQLYPKGDLSLTGMLTLKRAVENQEEPAVVKIQKRKNFGIKRLGVADYLKVVQSVHAYVPGEVSNIENVMASELRHKSSVARDYSEITDTTSKSQETEKISDTSKTSRTDMQTEVAKELERDQSITAHTRYSYGASKTFFEVGAEYANTTAQHDSTRQAVMKSQEITERAMERVLTKISEERVQKIIKEYTETNVHEFDNRGKVINTDNPDAAQPKHITGVYRWIDKKMKNQIYNYGKRTMFEFMVPEPSRLHRLALTVTKAQVLTAPVDPRTAPERAWTMPDPKSATVEQIQHWAQIYGVSLTSLPDANKSVSDTKISSGDTNVLDYTVPQNYICVSLSGRVEYQRTKGWHNAKVWVYHPTNGSEIAYTSDGGTSFGVIGGINTEGTVKVPYKGKYLSTVTLMITLNCRLSDAFIQSWKTESFNTIIKAYEEAYKKFQEEQARLDAEQKEKEAAAKERQGNFYRYMEHDTLKHNCIAYLLQDYLITLGQVTTNGADDTTKMDNFQVYLSDNLDQYAALAKFMEQAFEWEIMDYTFYPYYWANRKSWQEFYLTESMDPLFRSFLQAGMARIIVTVKPGFEAAVQFFLETGLIWNGGAVPVIGDPLYMSIVDEMRQPTGKPQGKYWITRVPTTLTILQDKSTGLLVDQPLPIFPESDPKNCENPRELEGETSFYLDKDAQLSHSNGTTTLPKEITTIFNK
ncbi:hypothetical protein [uncultured Chryseobacterium sp.]|uniref:hypothetical protein n=1 Tax=uncultured Chryseobacterium sp. TaxID=259322 RepID=UPI003748D099